MPSTRLDLGALGVPEEGGIHPAMQTLLVEVLVDDFQLDSDMDIDLRFIVRYFCDLPSIESASNYKTSKKPRFYNFLNRLVTINPLIFKHFNISKT